MRSLQEARKRWHFTLIHTKNLDELKRSVRLGENESPCQVGLRSICWKTCLLFQNKDIKTWLRTLNDSRNAYTALRGHFLKFVEHPQEVGSDPLGNEVDSPWNTLRKDEASRAEIFQDIERCMPEEEYFRLQATQKKMLDILFVFCKINQDTGYRQGMHELLAPLLWVVEQDAVSVHVILDEESEQDAILTQMLDREYIEHDAFTLFSLLMRSAKSFYELGEPEQSDDDVVSSIAEQHHKSPIVERSSRIHDIYLARLDPKLAKHLSDIDVLPQIFLIRWIRLLFGREFCFGELLKLWDLLLAEDPGLDLVDWVCVAALLRIRWQLVDANYSAALMLLLKYPHPAPANGPQTFVDDAIYLRDNFSPAGGTFIIEKYSGKRPSSPPPLSSTPSNRSLSPQHKPSRIRSPLSSPARYLKQQGGVEALLHGAAKGVYDRGERLGINKAVRDAVGEVRKNMQGLQTPRSNSYRGAEDAPRWSLDQGRSVPSLKSSLQAMNARNQQLARMLNQAMDELRSVAKAAEEERDKDPTAINTIISKVDFVKVCLEDSAVAVPTEAKGLGISDSTASEDAGDQLCLGEIGLSPVSSSIIVSTPDTVTEAKTSSQEEEPYVQKQLESGDDASVSPFDNSDSVNRAKPASTNGRPNAPIPTRSSIARSSFAWMLEEPVVHSNPGGSSPPKSSSPFTKHHKRTSNASRDRAAFLFGEEEGMHSSSPTKTQAPVEAKETFKLQTIRGRKSVGGDSVLQAL